MQRLAAELAAPLAANASLKAFTTNSDVIGAYAEATVRAFVKRMVDPANVCCGTVVAPDIDPKSTPQLDCIVWHPGPFPAIFEVDSFGVVPRRSVDGILEIKRSNYSGVGSSLDAFYEKTANLVDEFRDRPDTGASESDQVTSTANPTFGWSTEPSPSDGTSFAAPFVSSVAAMRFRAPNKYKRRLAVIGLFDKTVSDTRLAALLDTGDAVSIFNVNPDSTVSANDQGIMKLVSFLVGLRAHIQYHDGTRLPNMSYTMQGQAARVNRSGKSCEI